MADVYFKWLVDKVCRSNLSETHPENFDNNDIVFTTLYNRKFTYSIPMDANREADGLNLRTRFLDETGIRAYKFEGDCASLLEVLVALAIRCEDTIMGDTRKDRTYKWFWIMMDNMNIKGSKDESFINHAIDVMLNRTYNYDGTNGALFHVNNPRSDMRKTEIWYQMNWFLSQEYL